MTLDAFLYFALLAVWSAFVAYYALFVAFAKGKHDAHVTHHAPKAHTAPHASAHPASAHHAAPKPVVRGRFSSHEGFKSFARDVELTVEDIVHGLARDN